MLIAGLALCLCLAARAAIDARQFDNAAQERLYQELTQQLRCPKCQNTSIADSDAIIAADMRAKVYQLMRQGEGKQQIIDYMVARYGNFVTYAPPFNSVTIILWLGPLLAVVVGALAVARGANRRDAGRLIAPKQRRLARRLADRPAVPSTAKAPVGKWALITGIAGLAAVTLVMYALTGGARQVWRWQHQVEDMPGLRARIMNPDARPLSAQELAQFATGLRASLAQEPQNIQDWLILGRIGVLMNNAPMATQAFERAHRLAPADDVILLDYARALIRSTDAGDNQQGEYLLASLLERQPDNIQANNLLAIGHVARGDYDQAISLWRHVLTLLPQGDAHRTDIQRAINQARAQSGQESNKLEVSVTLSPPLAAHPPSSGTLFITVTDGKSPAPIAVKTLPLSRFPLSLTLDDGNAMGPQRVFSSLQRVKVRVRIAREGNADAQRGEWYGESELQPYGNGRVAVRIEKQTP